MKPLVREGPELSVETTPRRGGSVSVVVRAKDGSRLEVDTLSIMSAVARSKLVRKLPEAVQAEAAEHLKALAEEVHSQDERHEDAAQGTEIAFGDPVPWPDPVDGADLLGEIVATLNRFLSLPDGAAETVALWVLFAHAHDRFEISPLLVFSSPMKRCGKTTAHHVLGALVPRRLGTGNITSAALFRAIEKYNPTLLADEADTFIGDNDDLRGVLNSGHSKRSAFVVRTVGDQHEVRMFSTWSPKSLALIGSLPETLEDRSVVIRMMRRPPGERTERLRITRLDELHELNRKAAAWAAMMADTLSASDPPAPEVLDDRAADNWRPLLAVADAAGGEWPVKARAAAVALSADRVEDSASIGTQLLADIRVTFTERGVDKLPSKVLVDALRGMEDRPWNDWGKGRGLSANGLARILKSFRIGPSTVRFGTDTAKGYALEQFTKAFASFLPCAGVTDGGDHVTDGVTVVGAGFGTSVSQCHGVTDQTGGEMGDAWEPSDAEGGLNEGGRT